jgi:predicted XRE-type DNA-binding protein
MKKTVVDGVEIEIGSENVFADLGFPNPDERLLKAQLIRIVNAEIQGRGLSQERAAHVVRLKQSEVSRIARGRAVGFSTDRLIDVIRRLGLDVEIRISASGTEFGSLCVREIQAE